MSPAEESPPVYRDLLVHTNHMTVTVEEHYGSLVDVQVLSTLVTQTHYARAIFLTRQSDGAAVLFGIPRVNFAYLDPQVRSEIESQSAPLGRILIKHNVLREIRLVNRVASHQRQGTEQGVRAHPADGHLWSHRGHRLQRSAGGRIVGDRPARGLPANAKRRSQNAKLSCDLILRSALCDLASRAL